MTSKKVLSKTDILDANDIYIEELEVPEWGGIVYIKTLSGQERDSLEASMMEFSSNGKPKSFKLERMRATITSLGICDVNGKRLFEEKDIPALSKKSASALDRVVFAIQKLAGMSPADIESLIGDLKNDQPAASLTA